MYVKAFLPLLTTSPEIPTLTISIWLRSEAASVRPIGLFISAFFSVHIRQRTICLLCIRRQIHYRDLSLYKQVLFRRTVELPN